MTGTMTENIFYETVKSDFRNYRKYFSRESLYKIYDDISFITDFGCVSDFLYVIKELEDCSMENKESFWDLLKESILKRI